MLAAPGKAVHASFEPSLNKRIEGLCLESRESSSSKLRLTKEGTRSVASSTEDCSGLIYAGPFAKPTRRLIVQRSLHGIMVWHGLA